jgi:hypothetical protein
MIPGTRENFMAYGWRNARLYYKGSLYRTLYRLDLDEEKDPLRNAQIGTYTIKVQRVITENPEAWEIYEEKKKGVPAYQTVLTVKGKNRYYVRKLFFVSPIFDGKTFKQIENELLWVNEEKAAEIHQRYRDELGDIPVRPGRIY